MASLLVSGIRASRMVLCTSAALLVMGPRATTVVWDTMASGMVTGTGAILVYRGTGVSLITMGAGAALAIGTARGALAAGTTRAILALRAARLNLAVRHTGATLVFWAFEDIPHTSHTPYPFFCGLDGCFDFLVLLRGHLDCDGFLGPVRDGTEAPSVRCTGSRTPPLLTSWAHAPTRALAVKWSRPVGSKPAQRARGQLSQ